MGYPCITASSVQALAIAHNLSTCAAICITIQGTIDRNKPDLDELVKVLFQVGWLESGQLRVKPVNSYQASHCLLQGVYNHDDSPTDDRISLGCLGYVLSGLAVLATKPGHYSYLPPAPQWDRAYKFDFVQHQMQVWDMGVEIWVDSPKPRYTPEELSRIESVIGSQIQYPNNG